MNYSSQVPAVSHQIEVRQTEEFAQWLGALKDRSAADRIVVRIRRLELANPGSVEPVGEGVSELKIDYGPGYRVYFVQRGRLLIILLCGGDKKSQVRDIRRAKAMAKEV